MSKTKLNKKLKPCDLCSQETSVRYRIKYQKDGDWKLVCLQCWQQVSKNNPLYRYGGTWKARKELS